MEKKEIIFKYIYTHILNTQFIWLLQYPYLVKVRSVFGSSEKKTFWTLAGVWWLCFRPETTDHQLFH